MTFPAYPEYKDSGVEWIGAIPSHWSVTPVRLAFDVTLGKMLQPEKNGSEDVLVPYHRTASVGWETVSSESDLKKMWVSPSEVNKYRLKRGDLLICEGGDVGRAGVCGLDVEERPVIFQNSIHRVRPKPGGLPAIWLLRLMQHVFNRGWLDVICGKNTITHFTSQHLASLRCPSPTSEEAGKILAFLDHETARIDALIEEQQRLIELLKEKRQAVISHAVTKGLDPDVPMKDSGVEWLGEVPAHWDVVPLMRLTPDDRQIMYGIVLPGPHVDEGVPIVKGGDVKPGRLALDKLSRTSPDIERDYERSRLKGGDIVYAIRGGVGDAEIVPEDIEGANLTQDAARVSPRPGIDPWWLLYCLKSYPVFAQLEAGVVGATIRGINIWDLKRVRIPVPPQHEQKEIARRVGDEMHRLDSLVRQAKEGIGLLTERRSALISSAVTGKIDVRDWQPPERGKANPAVMGQGAEA